MKLTKQPIPSEYLYPAFGLRFNPFTVGVEAVDGDPTDVAFANHVYSREVKRLTARLRDWIASGETSKFWVVKDMSIDRNHHIRFSGSLLRYLMADDDLRVFPTIALLNLVFPNVHDGVLKVILDRYTKDHYRLCIIAFVCNAMKELVDEGVASQVLPELDVPALLREIEESEGEFLDRILYGAKVEPEEGKERDGAADDESSDDERVGRIGDEDEDVGEAVEGETATDETEDLLDEEAQRLELLRKAVDRVVEIKLERSSFGCLASEAVNRGLLSLEDGYTFIKASGSSIEALDDTLKFMSSYYRTVLVYLERIDAWEMLEDEERRRIYGEISEWKWVIGEKGCLAIAAGPLFESAVDPSFLSDAVRVEIDMHDIERDLVDRVDVEAASEMLTDFLSAARVTGTERTVEPFTESAVAAMAERTDGDAIALLGIAGTAIERAAEGGGATIDADFIKELDL